MDIIYTKFSKERSPRFSIKTHIIQNDDKSRRALKLPCSDEGREHILNMLSFCEKINSFYGDCNFFAAECRSEGGGVSFDFIEGTTFEERLEGLCDSGRSDEAKRLILDFKKRLFGCSHIKPFVPTEGFKVVFGEKKAPRGLKCMDFSCIDLIFDNIIESCGREYIIDYEWCFDFGVPLEFIVYRAVNNYITLNNRKVIFEDIFDALGIDEKMKNYFDYMEQNFQSYINCGALVLRSLYNDRKKQVCFMDDMIAEVEEIRQSTYTLFFDCGKGFDTQNAVSGVFDTEKGLFIDAVVPENAVRCRFDPCERSCCVSDLDIELFCGGEGYAPTYAATGCETDGALFFDDNDPMIMIGDIKEGTERLRISCEVAPLGKGGERAVGILKKNNRLMRFAEKLGGLVPKKQD